MIILIEKAAQQGISFDVDECEIRLESLDDTYILIGVQKDQAGTRGTVNPESCVVSEMDPNEALNHSVSRPQTPPAFDPTNADWTPVRDSLETKPVNDGLTERGRIHKRWLEKQESVYDAIIIETGPHKIFNTLPSDKVPQNSKVLGKVLEKPVLSRNIWLPDTAKDELGAYLLYTESPSSLDEVLFQMNWKELVRICSAAEKLEDETVFEQSRSAIWKLVVMVDRGRGKLFDSDVVQYAYQHTRKGSRLCATSVDVTLGSKYLLESINEPIEFVAEVHALMEIRNMLPPKSLSNFHINSSR
ncbi:hypothetical protein BCR34DRAFT_600413 [Clohesyomyces aquaticus]|uniref:Uncharacterized protein n=1 Tax=Clohesyomyces aquaticus TaxID=1231657 RepID=A0A1Y1ZRA1_9PLEO|nr:hypothetical protein BCR34DRAFT_600413 [Clohesyomyces aquaticus]